MAREINEILVESTLDLQNLLNGGLPLEKVGPHLRHAARRALRTGDPERMLIVARIIIAELLRRGDLLRVAVEGDEGEVPQYCLVKGTTHLLDLTSLGRDITVPSMAKKPEDPAPSSEILAPVPTPPTPILGSIEPVLDAMENAQKLEIGDPRSGEAGTILESILTLLGRFTPQFRLHVMIFQDTPLPQQQNRVFILDKAGESLNWFKVREPGHAVWIPQTRELPESIKSPADGGHNFWPTAVTVAVPLYGPVADGATWTSREEAGLLFVLGDENWTRDTMLRLATRLSRFVTHRWQQHSEMNKRIHVDALTGLFNKGYFHGQFGLLLERAKRSKAPLTLVIGDIDRFSDVNNTYGHLVGDQALEMVARRLQEELRRIDIICRVGGEELALILPDTDFEAAREVMTRLINAPLVVPIHHGGKPIDLKITLSYGAIIFPDSGTDADELYRKADHIMYLSKDRGRNQCHFWSTDGNHLQVVPSSESG